MTNPVRAHLAFHTLALAIGFSALAAGGIHLPVLTTYAVLVVASGLLVRFLPPAPSSRLELRSAGVAVVALALAVICLLQALPLPLNWLSMLAPRNADIWARAWRPLQQPALELASISLAPGRSLLEGLQLATYGVVFVVSAKLSRVYGAQRLFWLAFGSALAVAAVTAVHQLIGAERLYGLYRPMAAYNVAPLLNPNNRAGYLNLGFFCGLGLLFRSGSRPYLGLLVLSLCFLAAEVILCRSLGGTSSLAIGFVLMMLLLVSGRLRDVRRRGRLPLLAQLGVLTAIGGGAVALALIGQGTNTLGLDARALEKVELWRRAGRLAGDHFALGVGRGAFASVFPAYQRAGKNVVFEHAENFPLQWASEWGVPITMLALLALAWSLRPILSQSTLRSPTRRCALVGCAVLLIQNLADLGLELPAVAALLCMVLGALSGLPGNGDNKNDTESDTAAPDQNGVCITGCVLALASLALAIGYGSESPARLRRDLYEQLVRNKAPPASFWSDLERAVRAYPAEPYFPLLGASAAFAARSNALPWIAQALERNPHHAPTHLQLARILHARGATGQALGAVKRAVELDPSSVQTVLGLTREWQLSPAEFEVAAPLGRAGAPLLLLLAEHTSDVKSRKHLLQEALARDPNAADAHYRLALELFHEVSLADSDCSNRLDSCLTALSQHIRKAAIPDNSRAVVLEGRLLSVRGEHERAEQYLEDGCRQFPGDVKCIGAWVTRALTNQSPRLQDAVNAYVSAGCRSAEACAHAHMGLGTLFANAGRWHDALSHFQHATRESPTLETWQAVARAAEHVGAETTAREARRRVALFAQSQAPSTRMNAGGASLPPRPPETGPPAHTP